MEEFSDILDGLEQRIRAHQVRLQDLEKQRRRLDDEIATITKYLELAETLHRVEAEKAKASGTSSRGSSVERDLRSVPQTTVLDRSKEILLGPSKYLGMSVPEASSHVLREARRPMHVKELVQRLKDGGMPIKGKTPLISVATSLKRDKRFRKVGPNTFEAAEVPPTEAV